MNKVIKLILNHCRNLIMGPPILFFRYWYWSLFFKKIGKNTKFYGTMKVLRSYNISVGDNCSFNDYVILNARTDLLIGDNVSISSGVIINTGGLNYASSNKEHFSDKVIIEDGVWIGSNAMITPGITIGKNSVIGGGAVVVKDIPPNSVAGGVPAKVIKKFDIINIE